MIGANGLVGSALCKLFDAQKIPYQGTYHRNLSSKKYLPCDICNPLHLQEVFFKVKPTVVIHCANLSGGVNFCEKNLVQAQAFHFQATQQMVSLCQELEAQLIFISTDYVFDGRAALYSETDAPCPLNAYGRFKYWAEQWIAKHLKNYIIVRTTNVYGWDPHSQTPNYVMNLYRTLQQKKEFQAPSYLWGHPTLVQDLALAIQELSEKKARGIFHVVGSSWMNRYEWALAVSEILNLDSSWLKDVTVPPADNIRPLRPRLDTQKFRKNYHTPLRTLEEGLTLFKQEMRVFK